MKSSTTYLKDYCPADFAIPFIHLSFELADTSTQVIASLKVERVSSGDTPLILDGEKLELLSLFIDGVELSESGYKVTDTKLIIHDVPDSFTLDIHTNLQPHMNTELTGLYRSSGNFCTQCEAEGFRRITYFLDRPDVLSVYTVRLVADQSSCPVLLSNGNPVAQGANDDGTHWAEWHDPWPKPCYLFALVAGDLSCVRGDFVTMSGRSVALNVFTQAHNVEKCGHALRSLQKAMHWDEQVYGREYDLDVYNVVAVDDFNMGAMENKGLNIFNSRYVLADQQTATDADYDGIESVIGHEYFHNWSGNRVTCRDWFQLSLKEGFTVFRDQEFSADMNSRAVKRIRDVQVLRAHQFKEDAGPMAHPVRPDSYQEINNFYTVTIYNKGAEVIRMMRQLVGVSGFRKGTDLYFDSFDGQAATTEDFVQSIEKANGVNLQKFRRWYTQSGTPHLHAAQFFDSNTLTLTLRQDCPATPGQATKKPFHLPVSLALFDASGRKLLEQVLELQEAEQAFEFTSLQTAPVVSLLRDFSAPVHLDFDQADEDLLFLVQHEDNGFARYEAMQRLCLNLILPAAAGGEPDSGAYTKVFAAFQALISSAPEDKAIFAEMLTLPSAHYISELCDPIDPIRVSEIREHCVTRLAKDLESEFHAIYTSNNSQQTFSVDADAMAERALKNRALHYLVATGQAAYFALASHQYHSADNMTDRLAAFTALVHADYPERQILIDHFYQNWKHDPLVLDKWFAIQAMIPQPQTLELVVNLTQHESFTMTNPNKVRSLLGTFSQNLVGFHTGDGRGYRFLADSILELDKINPQVAARLAGVFNNWRRYTSDYADNMQSALQGIAVQPSLSKDVSEIVDKALMNFG